MAGDTSLPNSLLVEAAPTADDAGSSAESGKSGSNRRAYRRLRPDEIANLGAKLASGADVRLIDLSRSGAQFECDRRFLPNSSVSLRLVTSESAFVVNGRVVRSRIVRLEKGGLGYNVAVAFDQVLPTLGEVAEPTLTEVPVAPPAAPATIAERPARGHADGLPPAVAVDVAPVVDEEESDVSAEERAAYEATADVAPAMLMVTAAVEQTDEELRDMFNGNDW